jgi:hypothetical protein
VHRPITDEQEAALRALHDEIPTRPGHWTHHLEGSYPNKDELRTLEALGNPWLYIDHGWREMQWSTHDNSEVVRWTLRERGITLVGPDPKTLVDPVGLQALRSRMSRDAQTFLDDLATWINFDMAWAQRFAVATLCRILYTHDEGRVASKRQAMLWARNHVEPHWSDLIQQAVDDRDLGWDPNEPPRPGSVERTIAFAEYVKRRTAA